MAFRAPTMADMEFALTVDIVATGHQAAHTSDKLNKCCGDMNTGLGRYSDADCARPIKCDKTSLFTM